MKSSRVLAFLKRVVLAPLDLCVAVVMFLLDVYSTVEFVISFLYDKIISFCVGVVMFIMKYVRVLPMSVYVKSFAVYFIVLLGLSYASIKIFLADKGYITITPLDRFSLKDQNALTFLFRYYWTVIFLVYLIHRWVFYYKRSIVYNTDTSKKEND